MGTAVTQVKIDKLFPACLSFFTCCNLTSIESSPDRNNQEFMSNIG